MGYMKHHSIIVTTYEEGKAKLARNRAIKDFKSLVTPIRKSLVNSWYSFAILPDGSKEGWSGSNMFDEARDRFNGWLRKNRYEDNSSPYDAVEVSMDEEGRTSSKIIN